MCEARGKLEKTSSQSASPSGSLFELQVVQLGLVQFFFPFSSAVVQF